MFLLSVSLSVLAPFNVEAVTVTEKHRYETSVTLEWKKPVNGVSSYVLHFDDKENEDINNSEEKVTVSALDPGKRYAFTLFTVFEGIKSSVESDFTVTSKFAFFNLDSQLESSHSSYPKIVQSVVLCGYSESSLFKLVPLYLDSPDGLEFYILWRRIESKLSKSIA